jgi:hypothetical protein
MVHHAAPHLVVSQQAKLLVDAATPRKEEKAEEEA